MQLTDLGRVPYEPTFAAMKAKAQGQPAASAAPAPYDEALWLCEHDPVFTLGLAGRPEHLLATGDIPVVQTDRGGQVTYHGPGQLVAYPLIDLRTRRWFVKEYVFRLEEALIRTLAEYGVTGHRVAGAPGIYVRLADPFGHAPLPQRPQLRPADGAAPRPAQPDFSGLGKIAALGIKVSQHHTYPGVSLNVAMDLSPFARINPCGYAGLPTVDLSTIGVSATVADAGPRLAAHLQALLAD
jgi:lipoyl(octanoyl) transferase